MYSSLSQQVYDDSEFNERKAKGELKAKATYERVKNVRNAD